MRRHAAVARRPRFEQKPPWKFTQRGFFLRIGCSTTTPPFSSVRLQHTKVRPNTPVTKPVPPEQAILLIGSSRIHFKLPATCRKICSHWQSLKPIHRKATTSSQRVGIYVQAWLVVVSFGLLDWMNFAKGWIRASLVRDTRITALFPMTSFKPVPTATLSSILLESSQILDLHALTMGRAVLDLAGGFQYAEVGHFDTRLPFYIANNAQHAGCSESRFLHEAGI